jgi:hypothetical protein
MFLSMVSFRRRGTISLCFFPEFHAGGWGGTISILYVSFQGFIQDDVGDNKYMFLSRVSFRRRADNKFSICFSP